MYAVQIKETQRNATRLFSADPLFDVLFSAGAGRVLPMMAEADAEAVATAAAFGSEDEDEEGYIELLAIEAEEREDYRLLCTTRAWGYAA